LRTNRYQGLLINNALGRFIRMFLAAIGACFHSGAVQDHHIMQQPSFRKPALKVSAMSCGVA
jgi:hypothetical protein